MSHSWNKFQSFETNEYDVSPCRIMVLHGPGAAGPFGLAGSIPAVGVHSA